MEYSKKAEPSYSCFQINAYIADAFAKLRSLLASLCPSVCMEWLGYQWREFYEICYL